MADETQIPGAGGPGTGGPEGAGGGSKPPIDPATNAIFEKMYQVLVDAEQTLSKSEGFLKAMATSSGAVAEELDDSNKKMKEFFRVSKDVEDVGKAIVSFAKQRGNLAKSELMNTEKARKELQAMANLYKGALANAKGQTKETKAWAKNLEAAEKLLSEMQGHTKTTEDQWKKLTSIFDEAAKNVGAIDKALVGVSRRTAALKGMAGMLGSLGIGRGLSGRIDRRFQQVKEVEDKVQESKELRAAAVKKHMSEKRSKAIEEMGVNKIDPQSETGRQVLATKMGFKAGSPKAAAFIEGEKRIKALDEMQKEGVDPTSDEGLVKLATKMGFKEGSPKAEAFIAGEKGVGGAAGATEAGYAGAMEGGGGAIEALTTTMEDGLLSLTAIAPEIIIPLELLIEAVKMLTGVFDTYATQNKDMEKSLGAGGLFTQPGVSAGVAFQNARNALNPNVTTTGANAALGMTFERNLAMAQAMTEAGYNVTDTFGPNAQDTANNLPGAQGQFMKGSMGEAQRIVQVVSRVGGLTDEQGTANLIKLLQEYRETMASSEQFMNQLNKDTQAAGISTTKYLKIIDDVSSHFDKMSKSLEEVTSVMSELSRYGQVSSESLKDMMEFIAQGQDKTTVGNLAPSIYTQSIMPKAILDQLRTSEGSTVTAAVANVNNQLRRPGVSGIGDLDFTGAKTTADMQDILAGKQQEALSIKDNDARKTVTDALDKVGDQLRHMSTVGGGAMGRAAGGALYGEDLFQVTAKGQTNLDEIMSKAGASLTDFIQGNLSDTQMIQVQQEAEMLGVHDPKKAINLLKTEAQNRIEDARTGTSPAGYRGLVTELSKNPKGWKALNSLSVFKGLNGNTDDMVALLGKQGVDGNEARKQFGQMGNYLAGTQENQASLLKAQQLDKDAGDKADSDAFDQAADIGSRTQTIEELLKNVFKPILNDMLWAIEKIANSPLFGGASSVDQKKAQADIAAIPDNIKDLTAKNDIMRKDSHALLERSMKDGQWLTTPQGKADEKHHAELKAQMDENTKSAQYLGDQYARGSFGSQDDQDTTEKLLGDIKGYVKDTSGKKDLKAPDMTPPGFWKGAEKFLVGSGVHIREGGVADKTVGAVTYVYNIFSSDTQQDLTSPTTVGTSNGEHPENPKPARIMK